MAVPDYCTTSAVDGRIIQDCYRSIFMNNTAFVSRTGPTWRQNGDLYAPNSIDDTLSVQFEGLKISIYGMPTLSAENIQSTFIVDSTENGNSTILIPNESTTYAKPFWESEQLPQGKHSLEVRVANVFSPAVPNDLGEPIWYDFLRVLVNTTIRPVNSTPTIPAAPSSSGFFIDISAAPSSSGFFTDISAAPSIGFSTSTSTPNANVNDIYYTPPSLNVGQIVGIVFGGLLFLLFAIGSGTYFILRRRRARRRFVYVTEPLVLPVVPFPRETLKKSFDSSEKKFKHLSRDDDEDLEKDIIRELEASDRRSVVSNAATLVS